MSVTTSAHDLSTARATPSASAAASAMSGEYAHLLSPITVGRAGLTLRNRLVMGSMHTGMEERTRDLPKLAAYFAERARGGVGLMVTGGYAPNIEGWLLPAGSMMASRRMADNHRQVTDAVHEEDGRILLQLLHSGRYGFHPLVRSASATSSPISPFAARELSARGVERTIDAYVRSAVLAHRGGYDGIEVMGSEGYLINQFLAARTNTRDDAWGGTAEKRMRFPVEIVRRIRDAVGDNFLLQYRISLLDLVEDGQDWEETAELARRLEEAGVDVFTSGIGWHEARIPTIVTSVPRAAFSDVTARLRETVSVPVCASNRINDPAVGERLIADGAADLVSMARPLLADPAFAVKAAAGRADEINVCIACNQACLDHTFANKPVTCLVNPRAGRETELTLRSVDQALWRRKVAIIGAGVAGLACAEAAASRGLDVEVYEANDEVGGQFRYAMEIPGKEEFRRSLAYFQRRLEVLGVPIHTNRRIDVDDPAVAEVDHVVVATGVTPRVPEIEGVEHPSVITYADMLSGRVTAGSRVAILGAGGIGFDVAEYLAVPGGYRAAEERGAAAPGAGELGESIAEWRQRWGVVPPWEARSGLGEPHPHRAEREIHLFQRKDERLGKRLGKTTGWVHRADITAAGVQQHQGVTYRRIDDEGLHYSDAEGDHVLPVDTIVLCTGQESMRHAAGANAVDYCDGAADEALAEARATVARGEAAFPTGRRSVHIIGGADLAAELDAKRAIRQGVELASVL